MAKKKGGAGHDDRAKRSPARRKSAGTKPAPAASSPPVFDSEPDPPGDPFEVTADTTAERYEFDRRVDEVVGLIVNGWPQNLIVNTICRRYGVTRRHAVRYCRYAQRMMRREFARDREAHKQEAYARMSACFRDPTASWSEKLAAQKLLNQMLGLDEARKVAIESKAEDVKRLEIVFERIGIDKLQEIEDALFEVEQNGIGLLTQDKDG